MKEETKCYCGHTTRCDCGPEQDKMKNIHILPTPNESRLYYNSQEKAYQLCEFPKYHTDIKSTHNMYIASDDEIKEGDYCISGNDIYGPFEEVDIPTVKFVDKFKKIILTTDQDLIKDGVQAIDDEFLEWFVKNPSCEKINVKHKDVVQYGNMTMYDHNGDGSHYFCKGCEVETSRSKEELLKFGVEYYKIIIPKEKHKQETLEEAAENYANKKGHLLTTKLEDAIFKQGFIDGAKWQQERSCSEEEVIAFCEWFAFELNHYGYPTNENILKALKQFKKK